ncbi:uncharacterized protein TNCV_3862231 [Trichonephila clavipes]|nr:uncharacterized protein TNCV_3862231 [Trichonephila clavipes]
MAPHTITPAVGLVCLCKAKTGLRRSSWGLRTRTRLPSLLRLSLESLMTTWFHSAAVQFPHAWHHSKRMHQWVGLKGSTRNRCRDPKYPSVRRFHVIREDTLITIEGATCAWMAADEAVGCTLVFLTIW